MRIPYEISMWDFPSVWFLFFCLFHLSDPKLQLSPPDLLHYWRPGHDHHGDQDEDEDDHDDDDDDGEVDDQW